MNFFSELKRRNVLKVALIYAVVSWLLIEVAWILLPMFDAPQWLLTAFILLVVFGFIVTVFISWNFEMTPEGMKRTADITQDVVIPYWSRRKFATFIIGTAAIALCLLAYQLVRLALGLHQVSAAKRTDKIFIQGNPAGTQTVERQADSECAPNIPTTIAAAAITSLPPGNSMPPAFRSNTKATAMIT